jgi:hypothetical protein
MRIVIFDEKQFKKNNLCTTYMLIKYGTYTPYKYHTHTVCYTMLW